MALPLTLLQLTVQLIALYTVFKNDTFLKNTTERYYKYYMLLVVVVEILGVYYTEILDKNPDAIYNIYMLLSFLFFFHWFYSILNKKWLVLFFKSIFLIVYFYNAFTIGINASLLKNPLSVGTVAILILVFVLYANMLNSDEVINYNQSRKFWLATGILLFYIGFLPIAFLQKYIDTYGLNYSTIMTALNLIVYGCFIKGFTCKKK